MKNKIFGQKRKGICYEEGQGQTWRTVVLGKKKNISEPLCNLTVSSQFWNEHIIIYSNTKNDATLQLYFCSVVERETSCHLTLFNSIVFQFTNIIHSVSVLHSSSQFPYTILCHH